MATDTLEIFGEEFSGVTGIKATDDNSQIKTYIRPQGTISISSNGTGIDVSQYASADIAVPTATLETSKTYTVSAGGNQTISPSSGYDGMEAVALSVPSGTAGTPTASKGAVSNHSVSVTPSVTNTTGWIAGSTKNGTAVTVSASELVSGSETKTANGTYDVTNLAELVVNVPGGGGKAAQIATGIGRVQTTTYTATGIKLTVGKTGTYSVYWMGYRSSASGTNGSQLYINSSSYGSAITTFDGTYTNYQFVTLSSVSLTAGQVIEVYARARATQYNMSAMNLTIIEE